MTAAGPLRRITVLRHGESRWSREDRFQGRADVALSDHGYVQADAVAQALVEEYAAVWSSPLHRARLTAEVVAARWGVDVRIDLRLQEIDVGEWEGLTRPEVALRWPDAYAAWVRDPTLDVCGREPWASLLDRCDSLVSDLLAASARGAILAVTHATTGLALVSRLLHRDFESVVASYPLPPGGFVRVEQHPDGGWTASASSTSPSSARGSPLVPGDGAAAPPGGCRSGLHLDRKRSPPRQPRVDAQHPRAADVSRDERGRQDGERQSDDDDERDE
jgi:broad specificity phosphatase PhoE